MSEAFIGEVRVFAGNFAPQGWALCDGSALSISENSALFSLIGTTYGGDGVQSFALPDLRGRALIHQGQAGGTSYTAGQAGGAETVTLSPAQMPTHAHDMLGTPSPGTSAAPGPAVALAASQANSFIYAASSGQSVALADAAVGRTGGGQPHENRQPYVAISYIMALYGIYPARN